MSFDKTFVLLYNGVIMKKEELAKVDVSKTIKNLIRREALERSLKEDRYVSYKEIVETALQSYYSWDVGVK